ncbi:sugar ABC transporter substrate-binding protein [Salipaludibacillus keqinensis]|uniref:Sugar ABC transporter substrate-binding protein n=1 Tax=Salipaludibacillus keqinensis TaxID=2045207 RepID=A0A323TKN4_9BACI|nr:sugar ABC transporter substrate-binding protein [Salipaludibacillus keqinensis]PYZ94666.1 sugar ABC transporter substrate-binding protein [Salipaludibacillus keqinensis]
MKAGKLVSSLGMVSLLAVMVACNDESSGNNAENNNGGNNNGGNNDEGSAEKANIDFAAWGGPEEINELQELVDGVNEKSDEYEINLITIADDYPTALQTRVAGNNAPDIFYLSQEWVSTYANSDVLLDLTEYVENDEDLELEHYYEDTIRVSSYDDKLYGLPWISNPVILYYNVDIFDEAGIDYPDESWDWDQFRDVAKELTKDLNDDGRTDQWGFTTHGWPPTHQWIWSMGGDVVSQDGEVLVDSPESIEGLEILNSILNEDESIPASNTIEQQGLAEMFKAGRIGMFMGGAADDLDRVEGMNVEATVVPKGEERVTFNWLASMVASADTEDPDVTYQALKDMTEAIHTWKIVPPDSRLADTVLDIEPRKTESAAQAMTESMEFARGFSGHPQQQQIDTIVWDHLTSPLIEGTGSPQELAEDTAEQLRNLLEQE